MIKKIFVSVDLSTPTITEKVCKAANDMASKYDAEIQLVTILPDYGTPLVASFFPEGAQDKIRSELQDKLKAFNIEISSYEGYDNDGPITYYSGWKGGQIFSLTLDKNSGNRNVKSFNIQTKGVIDEYGVKIGMTYNQLKILQLNRY